MQSSPVQQITAAGNPNPNCWTMLPPPIPIPTTNTNTNFLPPSSPHLLHNDYLQHQIPTTDFWQLFMSGMETEAAVVAAASEAGMINHFPASHQDLEDHSPSGFVYGYNNHLIAESTTPTPPTTTTSPQSCITTLSEILPANIAKYDPPPPYMAMLDPTRDKDFKQCNKMVGNGVSVKKAKVQSSATQSAFKVRKFGDRITALHQIVSPFGKTDTASVLLEAIGYVRFLHNQIEALSLPYLSSGSGYNKRQVKEHSQSARGERRCIFSAHEDPSQVSNGRNLKRKRWTDQDLMSRGLCLVPISWTLHVGRDNGADYWAPVLCCLH